MKTILLKEAIDLIDAATAVYVDDQSLTFPELLDTDEEDGLFLRLETDASGTEEFDVQQNETVRVNDGALILTNTNGDTAKLRLLVCQDVK